MPQMSGPDLPLNEVWRPFGLRNQPLALRIKRCFDS